MESETIAIMTLIANIMVGIGALTGAYISLLGLWQARKNHTLGSETKEAVHEQGSTTNGRLTELLEQTARASEAIGHARGVEDERGRS